MSQYSVREWEEFGGRGEEKAIWIISMKQAGAGVGGFIIGQRVAELIGLSPGLPVFAVAALFAIVAVILFSQRRGMLLIRRLGIAGKNWGQRMAGQAPVVSTAQLWTVERTEDEELQPIGIAVDGVSMIQAQTHSSQVIRT